MMLGLDSIEDGHIRPMTALAENNQGPLWFFTSNAPSIIEPLQISRANSDE